MFFLQENCRVSKSQKNVFSTFKPFAGKVSEL
jgi:hypothetical protein